MEKMRKLFLSMTAILLFLSGSFASVWDASFEEAKSLALSTGKLIMVVNDSQLSNNHLLQLAQEKVVIVEQKLDNNQELLILDAFGSEILRIEKDSPEALNVLRKIPSNVHDLNDALRDYHEWGGSMTRSLEVGQRYTQLAEQLPQDSRELTLRLSDRFLDEARRLAGKENDKVMKQRARLLKGLNMELSGRYEETIRWVEKNFPVKQLEVKNMALTNYLLAKSYYALEMTHEASIYHNKLKMDLGGSEYYMKLPQQSEPGL